MTIEDVKKAQLKQLEALKLIDKICRDNNLQYMASCGTALGAVRHNGYIPWDVDTDIVMPQSDAIKLLAIVEQTNCSKISVCKETASLCDRIDINDTLISHVYSGKETTPEHMHIDITSFIPARKYPKLIRPVLNRISRLADYIIAYRHFSPQDRAFYKRFILSFADFMVKWLPNYKIREFIRLLAKGKQTSDYVTVYNDFYGFVKATYRKEVLCETIMLPFEDMMIPVSKHYDEYLTNLYGNWRQLPPENHRYPNYLDNMIYKEITL